MIEPSSFSRTIAKTRRADSLGGRLRSPGAFLAEVQLLRCCSLLPAILAASAALAADAEDGKRLAEMRCIGCHIVAAADRRQATDAPPFEVIAMKFAVNPEMLAFSMLDPHPRMNVMLTRREAQDIAAYINTLSQAGAAAIC